jgi:formate-dependent nitrite reductase membrane component NrfD
VWAERPAEELSLVAMVARPGAADAGAVSRSVYDVPHLPRPWGGRVAAYLWTKSIAAGPLLVAGLGVLAGGAGEGPLSRVVAPSLAMIFLILTSFLLIFDLKRPGRFHYVLFKPNWRSWLTWGAWILPAYGAVAGLWLLTGLRGPINGWIAVAGTALAGATAGYSAFLFAQAEGRDFWQSPLLLPQLLLAAMVAGAASLIIVAAVIRVGTDALEVLRLVLGPMLALAGLVLVAELGVPHGNVEAVAAARLLTRGAFRARFWGGVVVLGLLFPLALLQVGAGPAAAALALAGLWIYEDVWVKAGQSVPLS